jgi:helix-turn-helix protein
MADIGSTLREARMRERIDISEVEAQTKIRAKYLRAIENEEWDLLPGPIYAKSFLRTYSDYLGLDSRVLIDEFKRRYEGPSEHDARSGGRVAARERHRDRPRDRDRRPGRLRPPAWSPILLAVVIIVAILYVVGQSTSGSGNGAAQKPPAHHHRRRHAGRTHKKPAPAAPARVTLQLVPTGTVYVCLVNGRGAKLINEQTFATGQTIPSASARRLLLTLGNASVQMKVNGKPVPVAASASAIRLLITPAAGGSDVRHIPLSQTPTCP